MRQSLRQEPIDHTFWDPSLATLPVEPAEYPFRPIAVALRTTWDVLREAVRAHHQYEHLSSRRVPHDTALRQALGISHLGE